MFSDGFAAIIRSVKLVEYVTLMLMPFQASMLVSVLLREPNNSWLSNWTVLYYSNDILSKSLPDLGPYISLGITVTNVFMTFPPIILVQVS